MLQRSDGVWVLATCTLTRRIGSDGLHSCAVLRELVAGRMVLVGVGVLDVGAVVVGW